MMIRTVATDDIEADFGEGVADVMQPDIRDEPWRLVWVERLGWMCAYIGNPDERVVIFDGSPQHAHALAGLPTHTDKVRMAFEFVQGYLEHGEGMQPR